ncbi:MAG: hypothetical protein ACOXZV_05925 [Bacteroidales bacterium]|jgi:hypothetical protein
MAGKYSLITTLTLNAAGFNTGIDKAKKNAKALGDGVKTAGSTMATAFKPLGGILNGLSGQLGGVASVATGGISAFKAMIPAINGIKLALISSGIGAIVVALGTAFAALTSYLKGTEEGSMKLHKVMGYIKGAFNALLVRVQLLGEAVSLVFEGKFKQAGQKLKEAFSGGLLEEIKEDAKETLGYAERENKLLVDKRNLRVEESKLQSKINELKLIAWNNTGEFNAETRQKALNDAKALEFKIMNEKVRLAKEEYDIIKNQNAMSKSGTAELDKEADAEIAINSIKADYLSKQKEYLEKQVQINNALKAQAKIEREAPISIASTSNIKMPTLAVPINTQLAQVEQVEQQKYDIKKRFADMVKALDNEELQNKLSNAGQYFSYVSQLTGALTNLFSAQKERELKDAGNSVNKKAQIERKYAQKAKAMAVAQAVIGVAGAVINALQTKPFVPLGLASAALAGVLGGIQIATIKNQSFATGGIVGGSSYMGDKVHAMVNSGEMILTRSQQRNLFDMIGGGANITGGDVRFEIEGTKLVGVLSNYNRRINTYR